MNARWFCERANARFYQLSTAFVGEILTNGSREQPAYTYPRIYIIYARICIGHIQGPATRDPNLNDPFLWWNGDESLRVKMPKP